MDIKTFFVKKILMSFFVAVTCITAITAIIGMVFEPEALFGYDAFMSPILFGMVATLPSIVKYSRRELTVKQALTRNVIHLILIEVLTVSVLYLGGLIKSSDMMISLSLSIFVVYLTVSLVLWVNDKKAASDFNRDLARFQSKGTT
jgi:hypothetical protein